VVCTWLSPYHLWDGSQCGCTDACPFCFKCFQHLKCTYTYTHTHIERERKKKSQKKKKGVYLSWKLVTDYTCLGDPLSWVEFATQQWNVCTFVDRERQAAHPRPWIQCPSQFPSGDQLSHPWGEVEGALLWTLSSRLSRLLSRAVATCCEWVHLCWVTFFPREHPLSSRCALDSNPKLPQLACACACACLCAGRM
jgi:hypothetical protein